MLPEGTGLFDASGAHPANELQSQFGFELGRLLPAAGAILRRAPHAMNFADRFTIEQAGDLAAHGRLFTKTNSAMSRTLLDVQTGTRLAFRSPGTCLGLNIDAMETKALAALDGPQGRRVKDLWYDSGTGKFLLKFVPLTNGFPMQSMTILEPNEFPSHLATIERAPHSHLRRDAPRENMKLSFANALFWSGQAADPLPAPISVPESCLRLQEMLDAVIDAY